MTIFKPRWAEGREQLDVMQDYLSAKNVPDEDFSFVKTE